MNLREDNIRYTALVLGGRSHVLQEKEGVGLKVWLWPRWGDIPRPAGEAEG